MLTMLVTKILFLGSVAMSAMKKRSILMKSGLEEYSSCRPEKPVPKSSMATLKAPRSAKPPVSSSVVDGGSG